MGDLMQSGDVGVMATASEVAKNLTITLALIIALMGGSLEWYVWGRTYRRIIADYEKRLAEKDAEIRKRDAEIEWWQRLTLRATEVADWATRGYAEGHPPPRGLPGER